MTETMPRALLKTYEAELARLIQDGKLTYQQVIGNDHGVHVPDFCLRRDTPLLAAQKLHKRVKRKHTKKRKLKKHTKKMWSVEEESALIIGYYKYADDHENKIWSAILRDPLLSAHLDERINGMLSDKFVQFVKKDDKRLREHGRLKGKSITKFAHFARRFPNYVE